MVLNGGLPAYEGRNVEAALQSGIEGNERRLPDAYSEYAVACGSEIKSLRGLTVEPPGIRRELAVAADKSPVPLDLVRILDARDQEREVR